MDSCWFTTEWLIKIFTKKKKERRETKKSEEDEEDEKKTTKTQTNKYNTAMRMKRPQTIVK